MAIDFPSSPTIGDIHSVDNVNWLCTGLSPTKWEQQQSLLALKTISDTAPSSPVYGQMWLDTTTNISYTWNDIEWVGEVGYDSYTTDELDVLLAKTSDVAVQSGMIVSNGSDIIPSGYLETNGSQVSLNTYPDLYNAIGTKFNYLRNTYVNGKPWKQQYDENLEDNGEDITGWVPGTSLPVTSVRSQAIITKDRVYLLGGFNTSTVYTCPINSDGTLGTWTTGTSLPEIVQDSQVIVTNNRVHLLGGHNGSAIVSTVRTAPINVDGTLGTWTTGTSLPGNLSLSQAIVTKNRVYLMGGYNGTGYVSTVYTCPINSDGTLGTWTTTTSLPGIKSNCSAIVTKNRVYLLGGESASTVATIYTAPINIDGTLGTWTTTASLPGVLTNSQAFVTNNMVYIFGVDGYNSNISKAYTCPINTDGTLGTWTTGTIVAVHLRYSMLITTNSKVYILGGYNGSINTSTVYEASFLGGDNEYLDDTYYEVVEPDYTYINGKPWKQQYSENYDQSTDITGWTSGTSLPGIIKLSTAIVTKNRVYIFCGHNGTVPISTVYTAPINEDGTLGIWTTGTPLPIDLYLSETIVTKNRVYLLGGKTSSGVVSTVYTCPINTDGTLGTWVTDTSLPGILSKSQAIVTKNRVYLLGGFNTLVTSTVYTCPINTDGTLGTWTTGTSLPGILSASQVITTKNRVYLLGGSTGTVLSTVYTAPINDDGTLGTWTTDTSLPVVLSESQAIVSNNIVYLFGGYNGTSRVTTVYTAPINDDGTLGTWTTGTSLPVDLGYSQVIATSSKIYLLGGENTSTLSTVYEADFSGGDNDYLDYSWMDTIDYVNGKPWQQQYDENLIQHGDISWITDASLPGKVRIGQAIVTKNRVYLMGGLDENGGISSVYTCHINTDGTLDTWTTGTSLPIALYFHQAIVTKNRVYVMGGNNGSAYISTVYTAPINEDGTLGTWTTDESLPGILGDSQAIVTKNRVYLMGGGNAGGATSIVYTALINSDGTLGAWTTGTSLPSTVNSSQAILTKNRVYLLGGSVSSSASSTVHTAPINLDGTLGTWTTGTSLPVAISNSQSVVTNNRVYLFGGYNGSVYSSTVYTAPINEDGTLGTWTTSISLPTVLRTSHTIITNSKIYLLGGYIAQSTPISTVRQGDFLGGDNDYLDYTYESVGTFTLPNLDEDKNNLSDVYIKQMIKT